MLYTFFSKHLGLLLLLASVLLYSNVNATFIFKRSISPDIPETKAFKDCAFIALDDNQQPKVQVDKTVPRLVFEPNGNDKDSFIAHARNGQDEFTLKVVDHSLHLTSKVPDMQGLRMFEIKTSNSKWSYVWLKDNDECESQVGQNMPYFGSDVVEVWVSKLQ